MNLISSAYDALSREELLDKLEQRETTLRKFQHAAEEFICASFDFCDRRKELIALIGEIDREVYNINTGRK